MANLNFFALKSDQLNLLRFVYSETDCVVYESYSEYGKDLRRFRRLEELTTAYNLGADPGGNGNAIVLQLWSPSVMKRVHIQKIDLNAPLSFRYSVEGVGLMQLYFGGIDRSTVTYSHFGCLEEAGARRRSVLSSAECDWNALRKLGGRIQRRIKSNLAVAKAGSLYILPECFEKFKSGCKLKVNDTFVEMEEVDLIKRELAA